MSSTDYLRLSEHKIFKNVRETLPKDDGKTKNVMALSDDMLYMWDFQDNCVLVLNVKAARSRDGDNIKYQTLMPMTQPFFTPDKLIVNNINTLLIAFGPNGVFIFELPERTPPHGCFSSNKEIIYCPVHSLHEQTLAFNTRVEVRQVRFHPGAANMDHVAFLTSNNVLRIYEISKSKATCIGVYGVGVMPKRNLPASSISVIEALGEAGVDFDFGTVEKYPESTDKTTTALNKSISKITIDKKEKSTVEISRKTTKTRPGYVWPIYVLYGNGEIYTITITLGDKAHPGLKGPHFITPTSKELCSNDYCSILCIPSTPSILVIATCRGEIYHVLDLPSQHEIVDDKSPYEVPELPYIKCSDREIMLLESMEVELGLNTTHVPSSHCCPIFLKRDESKLGNYFASHETGVHFISMPCVDKLHKFLKITEEDDEILLDIVQETSTAEYILCTKISTTNMNPVIGMAVYYDPHSILALLADGQFVSLAVVTVALPQNDSLEFDNIENMSSPLKKMLGNPFDVQIQRILKQSSTQPILKLPSSKDYTQQECYELLQRATQVFRDEYFKNHNRAREEIEKRIKALKMLKEFQVSELDRMMSEKQELQETAEGLAEKYEDMKEKQEELTKRCETILKTISKKQAVPSNAEKHYHEKLLGHDKKVEKYASAVATLKKKIEYQKLKMQNWQAHNNKSCGLGSAQSESIKTNIQDITQKIAQMVKEVNEYKNQLNIAY